MERTELIGTLEAIETCLDGSGRDPMEACVKAVLLALLGALYSRSEFDLMQHLKSWSQKEVRRLKAAHN